MTRLLAFGDLHLGAGADYGREPGDRLRDQADVLAMIVQLAKEREVDAILFAGDLFDGPAAKITPEQYAIVQEQLVDLKVEGIPFIAITGNGRHDAAMQPVKAPEVLRGIAHVSTRPEVINIKGRDTRSGMEYAIAALPWTPVSRLVAARDGGDRDELHREAAAMLIAAARGLADEIPAGTPSILLGHWSVAGTALPNDLAVDDLREVVLDPDELEDLDFDVVVMGHIHKPQRLFGPDAMKPWAVYTGSPLAVDFGEANVEHGVWIFELDHAGAGVDSEFIPIESRPFVTVDVDLTTDRHEELGVDETDAVAAAIATRMPFVDAVVKVRYRATEEQARRIDWPKLRPLLDDAHKVYSVAGEILRSERARVDGVDEEIAPLEALDAWIAMSEVETTVAHRVREIGRRHLEEVGA